MKDGLGLTIFLTIFSLYMQQIKVRLVAITIEYFST